MKTIIYKYTHRASGKAYVGKTNRSLDERHVEHRNDAFRSMRPFQSAIRKYGIDAFDSEVLVRVDSEFGDFAEIAFIAALRATHRRYGYNVATGGEGAPGVKLSVRAIENLKRIAKTRKRREYSPEYRQSLREKMLGNKFGCVRRSEAFKKRASEISRGRKMSPEATLRRLISRYGPDYLPKGYAGRWARKQERKRRRKND